MARNGAQVSVADLDEEFRLGEPVGSYPLDTPLGVLGRVCWWIAVIFLALMGLILAGNSPDSAVDTTGTGVLLLVVAAVLVGLRIGLRRLSKTRNLHRCLTYENALVTTGWSGNATDWVLRGEMTHILEKRVSQNGWHTSSTFHITRADGSVFELLTPARRQQLRNDISALASRGQRTEPTPPNTA